jgi:hypothetical protein
MSAAILVRLLLWVWFGAAVYASHTLLLVRLPPLTLPALVLLLTVVALMAAFRIASVRAWVAALDLRALVLLHVTRFVGLVFLVLHQRGQLPAAFAVPAGFGDIVIALFALPVALAPLDPAQRQRIAYIWNIVGLIGELLVVATMFRLNATDPAQLRLLTHLPLSLLPTFLIPLLLATHVLLFVRLSRSP